MPSLDVALELLHTLEVVAQSASARLVRNGSSEGRLISLPDDSFCCVFDSLSDAAMTSERIVVATMCW